MSTKPSPENGAERYEALSVGWVDALRRHIEERAAGKALDFEVVFSAEYTDPPAHLLRNDGRKSVGYTIQVKAGRIEVLDGARPEEADAGACSAYDPFALSYRLPLEQYMRWLQEERPVHEAAGKLKSYGDAQRIRPLIPVMEMLDFYSKHTA